MGNTNKKIRPILLFDGECNLCNHWVDFMLKKETKKWFLFCSLQSKTGQEIVRQFQLPSEIDSVIVIREEKAYLHSDAVLQALLVLPFYLRWLRVFRYLPKLWRDVLYKQLAQRRYRWFGKRSTCRIPTPEEKSRFLG